MGWNINSTRDEEYPQLNAYKGEFTNLLALKIKYTKGQGNWFALISDEENFAMWNKQSNEWELFTIKPSKQQIVDILDTFEVKDPTDEDSVVLASGNKTLLSAIYLFFKTKLENIFVQKEEGKSLVANEKITLIDTLNAGKADKATTYTITEVDDIVNLISNSFPNRQAPVTNVEDLTTAYPTAASDGTYAAMVTSVGFIYCKNANGDWVSTGLTAFPTDVEIFMESSIISKNFPISSSQFKQGNWSNGVETSENFAIHSKNWFTLDVLTSLKINLSEGFKVYIWTTDDFITYNAVRNLNGDDGLVNGDSTNKLVNRYVRLIFCRTDLSTIIPSEIDSVYISFEVDLIPNYKDIQDLSNCLVLNRDFFANNLVFEQGNFYTGGAIDASYAIRSKFWYKLDTTGFLNIVVGSGFKLYILSTTNFVDFHEVKNSDGTIFFENGSFSTTFIADTHVRLVFAKSSGTDIFPSDMESIGFSISQEQFAPLRSINQLNLIPTGTSGIEKKLIDFEYNLVKSCSRLFDDKTGLFYQAGSSYNGMFLFDTFLPILSIPEAFNYLDILNFVQKFIDNSEPISGMFPMAINSNNSIHAYYSGADIKHYLPCGETSLWMPVIIEWLYTHMKDTWVIERNISQLAMALNAIPLNSVNGLVEIIKGTEWVPWGFEEIARFTGDVAMGSVMFWQGAMAMYRLYSVLGDATNANIFKSKADAILASMGTGSALWDSTHGMFYAATGQNRQISINASALAISCGMISGTQATLISNYLVANYVTLTNKGFIRQSNTDWQTIGMLNADNTYTDTWGAGMYQNGYWSVANKWVLDAIKLTSEAKAVKYVMDFLTTTDWSMEHYDNPNNIPTESPTVGMIVSTAGMLHFVRENASLFLFRQAAIKPIISSSTGNFMEVDINSDHIKICVDNNYWKKIPIVDL